MGVPTLTITCEGQRLAPTVEVLSVEIRRELNRIPEATVSVVDGSVGRALTLVEVTVLRTPTDAEVGRRLQSIEHLARRIVHFLERPRCRRLGAFFGRSRADGRLPEPDDNIHQPVK